MNFKKPSWKSTMILLGALLVASGCTSKETQIKEAAMTGARTEFEDEVKTEIAKRVSGKVHLQATAVRILSQNSTLEVVKIQDQGEEATAIVEVKTEPEKVKENLLEIMTKLEDEKEARFNVPDALKLIRQKLSIPEGAFALRVYKIKLKNTGDWQVVREPKTK
jgi:hypothetical protein